MGFRFRVSGYAAGKPGQLKGRSKRLARPVGPVRESGMALYIVQGSLPNYASTSYLYRSSQVKSVCRIQRSKPWGCNVELRFASLGRWRRFQTRPCSQERHDTACSGILMFEGRHPTQRNSLNDDIRQHAGVRCCMFHIACATTTWEIVVKSQATCSVWDSGRLEVRMF